MANPIAIARDTCDVPDLHPDVVRAAREALLPLDEAHDLAEIFSVLADPTRVRIVQALAERELCVCDLANVLRVRQSTVSHQLRLLRALRVVRFRKEGRVAYYALDDDAYRQAAGAGAGACARAAGRAARAAAGRRLTPPRPGGGWKGRSAVAHAHGHQHHGHSHGPASYRPRLRHRHRAQYRLRRCRGGVRQLSPARWRWWPTPDTTSAMCSAWCWPGARRCWRSAGRPRAAPTACGAPRSWPRWPTRAAAGRGRRHRLGGGPAASQSPSRSAATTVIWVAPVGIVVNGVTALLFLARPQVRPQHSRRLPAHGRRRGGLARRRARRHRDRADRLALDRPGGQPASSSWSSSSAPGACCATRSTWRWTPCRSRSTRRRSRRYLRGAAGRGRRPRPAHLGDEHDRDGADRACCPPGRRAGRRPAGPRQRRTARPLRHRARHPPNRDGDPAHPCACCLLAAD